MTDLAYSGRNTPDWWGNYFKVGGWKSNGGCQQTTDHMKIILDVLKKHKIDIKNKSVLDIGCALGEGVQMLHEAGANAVGADFSHEALKQARNSYPHLQFFQTDIRELEGHYDIIIASHILEHMGTDTGPIISNLKYQCDTLVVSVPNMNKNYDPNCDGVHTGLIRTALEFFPPKIRDQTVCIW